MRNFFQVDVFGAGRYRGNPLAVVPDAAGLDDAAMARFARWTNLSETTFLLPGRDGADYSVRIFTPGGEIPFAGHPTLGSAWVWLMSQGRIRGDVAGAGGLDSADGLGGAGGRTVLQHCGAGLVRVEVQGGRLAFAAPPLLRTGPLDEELLGRCVAGCGLSLDDVVAHQWVDNGPGWVGLLVRSADVVLAARPQFGAEFPVNVGLIGPQRGESQCGGPQRGESRPGGPDVVGGGWDYEVRAFVPVLDIVEDPVTGSLNAGLAQWLTGAGLAPQSYVVRQGTAVGRDGRVYVQRRGGDIWVSGDVHGCIRGSVEL